MPKSEAQQQAELFQALEHYTDVDPKIGLIYSTSNGRYRNIRTARMLKREGQKRGVPDICIPLKGKRGEPGAYVEMKVGYSKPSSEQETYLRGLSEEGFETAVAYDWYEALQFILNYRGLKPKPIHKRRLEDERCKKRQAGTDV